MRQARAAAWWRWTSKATLDELADQLVNSDLSINVALNLDGGSSTGLYVNAASQHVAIDSPAQLPIVIIVRQV